jgi:hypothetical protein
MSGPALLVHSRMRDRPLSSTVPRSLPFTGRITITGDDYGSRLPAPRTQNEEPRTKNEELTPTFNPQRKEGHIY